jgi:hypothetical protein
MNGVNMTARKALLGCGVASSVLYVAADVLASRRYPGYRYADYSFSELLATESPVRGLMIALSVIPYGALVTAFGVGVWAAAGPKRAGRLTGALLIGYAAVGVVTPLFFQAPTREALEAGTATWRNALHLPLTAVNVLCPLLAMGVGATLLGKRFRWYSYGTLLTLIVFGALTSVQVPRLVANQPTPWMGLEERVNIYTTMLWVAVLAIGLWRAEGAVAPRHLGRPAATPASVGVR